MDFFLDDKNCIDRLIEEWNKYGQLIVAVDFDNTLFDYYKKGYQFNDVIELVKELKIMGCHITIFTSCDESRFPEIKEHMKKIGVEYDSINETPDYIPFKGRKVYFSVLLDDRAGLSSAYKQIKEVIQLRRIYLHNIAMNTKQDIDF